MQLLSHERLVLRTKQIRNDKKKSFLLTNQQWVWATQSSGPVLLPRHLKGLVLKGFLRMKERHRAKLRFRVSGGVFALAQSLECGLLVSVLMIQIR